MYLADTILSWVIPATVPCIKAPVFREEDEWRLVCQRNAGIQYRVQKGRIVPYLKCIFRSPESRRSRERLPISKVYLGPSEWSDLSELSVRGLLQDHGFSNDETVFVVPSEIPLRP
jgi:hypothetical protein